MSIFTRMGAHYTKNDTVGTEQDINVTQIISHEHYKAPFKNSNDIALLKLASPAVLGQGVGTACLPDPVNSLANKICWVTGWGTVESGGNQPGVLMEASVSIISHQRCVQVHQEAVDSGMMCAGVEQGGVDACEGDSGGPLVCDFNRVWYVEGVVSWGDGCGDQGAFGVYSKVREFLPWIYVKMNNNNASYGRYSKSTFLYSRLLCVEIYRRFCLDRGHRMIEKMREPFQQTGRDILNPVTNHGKAITML